MGADNSGRGARGGNVDAMSTTPPESAPVPLLRARIRLTRNVSSDIPGGHYVAFHGEHVAEFNRNGAAAVRLHDGSLLGVKPDEFVWLERPPCGPAQAVWDAATARILALLADPATVTTVAKAACDEIHGEGTWDYAVRHGVDLSSNEQTTRAAIACLRTLIEGPRT